MCGKFASFRAACQLRCTLLVTLKTSDSSGLFPVLRLHLKVADPRFSLKSSKAVFTRVVREHRGADCPALVAGHVLDDAFIEKDI
jgi:hypothetical protein